MRFVGDIAEDAEVRALASGAITDGEPVIVNSTGTVSGVTDASTSSTLGTKTVISASYAGAGNLNSQGVAFDSTNNRVVIHYRDQSSGNAAGGLTRSLNYVAVGTVSGNSISFGTSVWMRSGTDDAMYSASAVYDSNANRVVLLYSHASRGYAKVGTVDPSDNSISLGSETEFRDDYVSLISSCFDSSNNKIVIAFRDGGNSNYGTAIVATVDPSDNSITFGSRVVFESADVFDPAISFDSSNNKVVIAYQDRGNSNYGTAIVGTVSGTGISFGSPVVFESAAMGRTIGNTFDSSNNKIVLVYEDDANSDYGTAIVGTVSGTSISFGTAAVFESAAIDKPNCLFSSAGNTIVIAYRDDGDSGKGKFLEGTVSGTDITFGSPTEFDSGNLDEPSALAYDSQNNKVVLAYGDKSNSAISTARVIAPSAASTLTSENFIGFAHAAYADGQKATIKTTGSIARNIPSLPATLSGGTAAVFESATTAKIGSTFDSSNNKIVIAYRDEGNSEHGTAIVGTVSGTDISFGSPTVFESAAVGFLNENSIVFDSNANKVVIAYEDEGNSQYGTAVVGTVSGTSISFGTPVVFESAQTFSTAIAFDSSNNKVVIAYEDQANSEHGTAIVGTVSGTSISFGSATVFNAGDTLNIRAAFDSTNNKVVIAYTDAGNSNQGTAIVGTVSGTSISFGSEAVFDTSTGSKNNLGKSIVFDSNAEKVLISYVNVGDSEHGYAIVGTVSGTSISFGSAAEFENAGTTDISSVFDSSNNLVVIAYRDDGNSFYGTAVTASISGTNVSFTSPVVFESARADEISIAYDSSNNKAVTAFQDAGNSNHGTAVVLSVDTSLTIGQQYFVQTDGSLGTSADSPSVIAGTSIGTSDIIVKG